MLFEEYINFKKFCYIGHCGVSPVSGVLYAPSHRIRVKDGKVVLKFFSLASPLFEYNLQLIMKTAIFLELASFKNLF
jgi:hypothetical protein